MSEISSLPSNLRPNHPRRVICGAIWQIPMKIADRSWSLREQALATLTLTRWPSYTWTNLTHIPWRYTGCAKINFIVKALESYRVTDRQTDRQTRLKSYITPLRGWLTHDCNLKILNGLVGVSAHHWCITWLIAVKGRQKKKFSCMYARTGTRYTNAPLRTQYR